MLFGNNCFSTEPHVSSTVMGISQVCWLLFFNSRLKYVSFDIHSASFCFFMENSSLFGASYGIIIPVSCHFHNFVYFTCVWFATSKPDPKRKKQKNKNKVVSLKPNLVIVTGYKIRKFSFVGNIAWLQLLIVS